MRRYVSFLVNLFLSLQIFVLSGRVYALCNASIQLTKPDGIYVDNFDGTITDTETGLVWAKCSLGQSWVANTPGDGSDDQCSGTATTYTWKAALESAQTANAASYLGRTDWRLPNKNELESLVEAACTQPAINGNLFTATVSAGYWSASAYTGNDSYAVYVHFYDGVVGGGAKSTSFYARVVRGGY